MAAPESMPTNEIVRKLMTEEHLDVVRESVAYVVSELMNAEVAERCNAGYSERTEERQNKRNGYRERSWQTRAGELELRIPRLRMGSYYPSFLEPRKRGEQALFSVVQEAYVNGVSTRKVDRLVEQLGCGHLSKDAVSRICRGLDEQVEVFRNRPLEGRYPYLWLDAKIEKVRDRGHVRQKAVVVAYAVHETGRREVIGFAVGEAETAAFWREFLRSLVARGLQGVKLAVSDAHPGVKAAIAQVLGCAWQRCTVHFLRDMLGHCRKQDAPLIGTAIRQVFNSASGEEARERAGQVLERIREVAPKVAELFSEAEPDLLAFYDFPSEHWTKLRSTNPLERINKEIARRTDVVGIFPNDQAAIRLVGSLLIEQNDEWLVSRRYLSAESLALVLEDESDLKPEVRALQAA